MNTRYQHTAGLALPLLFIALLLSSATGWGQNTGQWSAQSFSGVDPEKRHESAFVRVDDRFYLLGGRGKRTIQVYDPATKIWTNTKTSLDDIHHFQAVAYRGNIYLLGALRGGYPDEDPLANVLIYDPQQDKLTTGPTIPVARRRGSSGVVVYNNKMYVVAGNRNGHSAFLSNSTTPANVAWMDKYDPLTGSWTVLPDAPHARDHFFAEVIGDKLYVAGGRRSRVGTADGAFKDTEVAVDVFDLTTERWLTGQLPDNLPTARAGAPTAVINNELLVIGGEVASNPPNDLALSHTEVLNTSTGKWRRIDNLVLGRHATQAIVYDNEVYVAAGSKTRGGTEIGAQETYLEKFSYGGGLGANYPDWTTIGNSPLAKSEAQVLTYGGEWYVFNGFGANIKIANTVAKYNPATNTWTPLTPMPTINGKVTAVTHHGIALVDGVVWLVGGRVGNNPGPVTDAVWLYDIASDRWTQGPKLPLRRGGGGLGRLGHKLHYVGGFDENASCDVDIHLVYDLDDPSAGWQDLTDSSPMPMPRNHFGTVVYAGKLYTVGGQNGHDGCGGGKNTALLHVYDPVTDKWTRLANLPAAESHLEPSVFVHNDKLLLVGGQSSGKSVWQYDPTTDNWSVLNDLQLPQSLLAPAARVYGSNLFALNGGAPGTANPVSTTRVRNFTPLQNPQLAFNPGTLTLALEGTQSRTAKVILANLNGEEGAPYQIDADALPEWLEVDLPSGYARESFAELTLTVNSQGLTNGTYTHTLLARSAGYRSASLQLTLTVSGRPTPPAVDDFSRYLEAECATVGSAWTRGTDPAASGAYLAPPGGRNATGSPPDDIAVNLVSFRLNVPQAGAHTLHARIKAPTAQDDSFWVRINGGSWIKWWQGLRTGNQFDWREVLGSPFELPAGPNVIDFAYREDGTLLDKLFLTNTGTQPSGPGGSSSNCTPTPPDPDPNPAFAVRINAGGPEVGYAGETYAADQAFSGGKTYTNPSASVPDLYQTERSSTSPYKYTYTIAVPNGDYLIRLHFAEIYFGANGGGPGGAGKRVFDVRLEDRLVLDNFDLNAEVGPQTVVVKEYSVTVTDGAVSVSFDASAAAGGINQPKLSALEVIGNSAGTQVQSQWWAEAECVSSGEAWQRNAATTASGSTYVVYPGNANVPAPTTGSDRAAQLVYTTTALETGNYELFLRLNVPSPDLPNSFWVSVDGQPWIKYWRGQNNSNILTSGFEWKKVYDDGQPISFNLTAGTHEVRIAPREEGTQLDKLYLSKDGTLPTGLGDKADNCSIPSAMVGNTKSTKREIADQQQTFLQVPGKLIRYPNPVMDRLTFRLPGQSGTFRAQVIDSYGRVVLDRPFVLEAGAENYLDVTALPPTTYYLRVVSTATHVPLVQTFIKQ